MWCLEYGRNNPETQMEVKEGEAKDRVIGFIAKLESSYPWM